MTPTAHMSDQMPQAISPGSSQTQADGGQLLETFKSILATDGLYQPATGDAQASHDDTTLMYV